MYYVVSFVFDPSLTRLAVVRKNRPKWQKGKLNGIGGHIEQTDTSVIHAAQREFKEETSVYIPESLWNIIGCVQFPKTAVVLWLATAKTEEVEKVRTVTDELVSLYSIKFIRKQAVVNNFWWHVELSKSFHEDGSLIYFSAVDHHNGNRT